MTDATHILINSGYRYAYSLCANSADAQDLVQEAWTRLCAHGGVRDRAQLFTTIKRLFIDQYRRSRIVQFVPLSTSTTPEASSQHSVIGAQPSFDGAVNERLSLENAMRMLRHEEREALYLSVVEGYTAQEISESTGKPRNTILSHIHRAKRHLAELLATDSPDQSTQPISSQSDE